MSFAIKSRHERDGAMTDRVKKLEEKQRKIAEQLARIRQLEAQSERKADTKRKILLGSMLQEWIEKDDAMKQTVMARLEKFLTRNADRRYFGLSLVKATPPHAKERTATDATVAGPRS